MALEHGAQTQQQQHDGIRTRGASPIFYSLQVQTNRKVFLEVAFSKLFQLCFASVVSVEVMIATTY
jgi:hypothetical protein